MNPFPQAVGSGGKVIELAVGHDAEFIPFGATIDWDTVAAVSGSDVELESGITGHKVVIPIGTKYLRHGQVMAKITASGKYGPYDPAADDGRQTLSRGNCFLVNASFTEEDAESEWVPNGALNGGTVWKARLKATTGTASLAAGPTFTALEAAFPRLRYLEV